MDAKFTPGPWRVDEIGADEFGGDYTSISSVEGSWFSLATVVTRMESEKENKPEGVANAHLIAAAPDLYAVLNSVLNDIPRVLRDEGLLQPIEDALAKARGETA